MSKQVQLRRGTTAEHATFTGAAGEVTVDITKNVVVVHDATTPGGHPMASGADLEAIITEINTPTTLTHTQTESVKSLPTGTLDGVVDNFETRGLSLVNSVVNGDFSAGTTGWGAPAGLTFSVVSGEGKVIDLGLYPSRSLDGATTNLIPASNGNKIFISADIYMTSGSTQSSLGVHLYDSANAYLGSQVGSPFTPTANKTKYSTIITLSNANVSKISQRIGLCVALGESTKYIDNVFAINMTALGIEDYTEAQMLDLVRGGYFDGLKGVENAEVKTVGKNLFDHTGEWIPRQGYSLPGGFHITENGVYAQNTNVGGRFAGKAVRVQPGTYRLRASISGGIIADVKEYDSEPMYWDGYGTAINPDNTYTFTKPWVLLSIDFGSAGALTGAFDIQMERADAITPYEPHKSSHLTITPTLRSLPNGVHDRVYEADGQMWLEKNVEEYVLQSADVTYFTNDVNIDWLYVTKPTDSIINGKYGGYDKTTLIDRFSELSYNDNLANINTYDVGLLPQSIRIVVAKGTYANLAAAQAALAGTVIHYQLATPQLINLTEQGLTEGELMAFENGTVYLDADAFHVPSASFDVPTNTGAVIQSLVESANAQAKAIESKASKEQEDWIEPTLLNGWVNYGGGYNPAGYYKDEFGVVHLRGYVKLGTINTAIFTLTDGYKPLYTEKGVTLSNDAVASYLILSNGEVRVPIGHNTYVSLDGISFKAGE